MFFFTATIYKNIIYDSTPLNCVNGEPVCPFNCNISLSLRLKFNSDMHVDCVNHGICDSIKTVLFHNQFLECNDLGTLGQLLGLF